MPDSQIGDIRHVRQMMSALKLASARLSLAVNFNPS